MNQTQSDQLRETLVEIVRFLRAEIAGLEKRLQHVEQRKAFDYTGTFKQGQSYTKGQGCTHDGSIFIAMRDYPDGTPGTAGCGWKLACKRGRDAR